MVEGLKNTEVGVIPSDWELCSLGEIGSFKNGINKGKEDFGHGSPFVNLLDVFGKNYIDSSIELGLINSNDFERQLYSLKKGDVIFVRSSVKPSGVGLTILCKSDLPNAVFSGFLIRFRDNGKIDLDFKIHCFYEEGFRKRLISNSTVSANTNINQVALKALLIPLPPTKAEQTAIATALNDADALIQKLEQLIAKKRNIKTGAMQELLKPKEGWVESKLADECDLVTKGTTPTSVGRDFQNSGINFIKIESLTEAGKIIKDKVAFIDNYTHNLLKRSQLKSGDALFSIAGALGRVAVVTDEILPANTNQALAIIRLKKDARINLNYLFYFLNSRKIQNHILAINVQGAQANLSLLNIAEFIIEHPNETEQILIAKILSDMDNEIQELEKQLEKYKMMKQGMMQSLLTGKIRLV